METERRQVGKIMFVVSSYEGEPPAAAPLPAPAPPKAFGDGAEEPHAERGNHCK